MNQLNFQAVMKIYVFLFRRPKILQLSNKFHAIYLRNSGDPRRKLTLDRFVSYTTRAYTVLRNLYAVVAALIGFCPLIAGILLEKRILPFGLFLPFMDHKRSPGFEMNYAYSLLMITLGIPGLAASETYFVIHVILGIAHLTMMIAMLDELNEVLQKKNLIRWDYQIEMEIERRIKDVINEHQDHFK